MLSMMRQIFALSGFVMNARELIWQMVLPVHQDGQGLSLLVKMALAPPILSLD